MCVCVQMAEFVSESESDDDELLPPAKMPKVETSDHGDAEDEEEAAEFAPTGLDDEEPQSGADDWVIGASYRRTLQHVEVSHPLFGAHYFGQAVRSVARYGTDPQKVAQKRWMEEDQVALRVPKRIGLLAVILELGAEAFENEVLDFRTGYRRDVQPWADEQEKGMIAAYGGPLCDMHARLRQTLNLTDGGKGDFDFKGRIALNNLAWRDFQLALTEFVKEHGTAYVPKNTILPSGYNLGEGVRTVRKGILWKGWPDAEKRKEWLESLPNWTWNAAQSDERKAARSKARKQYFANETDEQRAERLRNMKEAHGRPEVRAANSERAKKQFATQEARDAVSERTKQQFANETDEQRAERLRKNAEAKRRPEVRTAASEKTKQQFATQEARDAASERTKQQFATQEARDAVSQRTKQQFATQEGRDRNSEGHRKAAKAKHEAKLATLSEAEQAKARASFQRNQDKQAHRKRRLDALRRVAGWEHAAKKDLPKAKAAGIVLEVCSCGVVCECGQGAGSSSGNA